MQRKPLVDQKPGESRTDTVPVFDVAELVARGGEAVLVHGDDRYRLRITARGKLILTK